MTGKDNPVSKKIGWVLLVLVFALTGSTTMNVDRAEAMMAAPVTTRISGWVDPTQSLTHVYIACYYEYVWGEGAVALYALGNLPAGRTDFNFSITDVGYEDIDFYTVLGIYDRAQNGLTVGMDSDTADYVIGNGLAWDDNLFGPSNATGNEGFVESEVAGYLENGMATEIAGFVSTFAGYFYYPPSGYPTFGDHYFAQSGAFSALVNFSGATDGGGAFLTSSIAPLPGAVWLLVPGLLALTGWARRQKRRAA